MPKQLDRSKLQGKAIVLFRAAIRSNQTLDPYERKLLTFLNWANMTADEFVRQGKKNPKSAEYKIVSFILEEKKRVESKQIAGGTLSNTIKSVRLLLEMNDVLLNWRKLRRILPPVRRYAEDRIPTIQELRTMINGADLRGKALILILTSSGIREGAISLLKVGDITPIKDNNKVIAGRVLVYGGQPEQYVTFITVEAWDALQVYLDYRKQHGENISKTSPLIRDKFEATTMIYYRAKRPDINKATPLGDHAIRDYFNRLLFELGFRKHKAKRHEFSVHSLRKFFKTKAESAAMQPIQVETLLNHSTGISDSYYKATEHDLREAYLAIAPHLTISEVEEVKRVALVQEMKNSERIRNVEDLLQELITDKARASLSLRQSHKSDT